MRCRWAVCALWGLASALVGCSDVTQLIVVVDTDYDLPSEVDELRVEVTGPSGNTRSTAQPVASSADLPMTLTVVPSSDVLGPVDIRAVGLLGGVEVAEQQARVTLEDGRSLYIRMFLTGSCDGVGCAADETCVCGACEPVDREGSEWSGSAPTGPCELPVDAGPPDEDGGGRDGGIDAAVVCTDASECDDGIACTDESCEGGACVYTAQDAACTDGTGGVCIEGFGCQYDGCSPSTCVAGPCQTARCDGDQCVLEPACDAATEQCCAGTCVPIGCDDGNGCTDDSCDDTTGCVNAPNTAACDDGTFCNGPDTCSGGTCTQHAGDPCIGGSVCDTGMDRCVGCANDSDCPADVASAWGTCSFSGTCDEDGSESRTVTSYACVSNVCQPSSSPETRPCSRSTAGMTCGSTTFGTWGSCGGFSDACDESGSRTRTRTDRVCSMGACRDSGSTDTGSCSRNTDGDSCGMSMFTPWSTCGGFSGTCDESGTQTRTRTDYTCGGGMCGTSDTIENRDCVRDQGGVTCAPTAYGMWGPCTGFSGICDESGTRTRSETTYKCDAGSCAPNMGTDSGTCSRSTDGNDCSSFVTCQFGSCNGGTCNYFGPACFGMCCEPGICVGPGESCP